MLMKCSIFVLIPRQPVVKLVQTKNERGYRPSSNRNTQRKNFDNPWKVSGWNTITTEV